MKSVPFSARPWLGVKVKVTAFRLHNCRECDFHLNARLQSCDPVPAFLTFVSSSPKSCRCESCRINTHGTPCFSTSLSLKRIHKINPFRIHSHLSQPLSLFMRHPARPLFCSLNKTILHVSIHSFFPTWFS